MVLLALLAPLGTAWRVVLFVLAAVAFFTVVCLPGTSGLSLRSALEGVDPGDWLWRPQPRKLYAQTLYQQDGYETTLLLIEAEAEEDGEEPDDVFDHFTGYGGAR